MGNIGDPVNISLAFLLKRCHVTHLPMSLLVCLTRVSHSKLAAQNVAQFDLQVHCVIVGPPSHPIGQICGPPLPCFAYTIDSYSISFRG